MFGAAMKTTSTSGSSTTARQSAAARANPNEPTASSRRSGSVSPQTTSSASKSRSANSVGMRSSERLWAWPSQPKPITPTPIRRRAPPAPPRRRWSPSSRPSGRRPSSWRLSSCSRASSSAPPDICLTSSSREISLLRQSPISRPRLRITKRSPDRVGVMRVVGDEDDAEPAVPRLRDVAQHDARLLDAQRRGRLVQDQDLGPEVDRAGDGHRLALAAGERADRLVGVADVDAHLAQLLVHRALRERDVDVLERAAPSSARSRGRSCARST